MTKKTIEDNGNDEIKKIPYGISDYSRIRSQNYYYVDKTTYLPTLENAGSYLFFIRPRRFGKSLFISIMEAYYDVYYKERFDEFFKGTWIHNQPTRERGEYLVLSFNFASITPAPEIIETDFLNHVQKMAVEFLRKYDALLSANPKKDYFIKKIEESQIAPDILSSLFVLCEGAHLKLYVFIDEYDNFANTILSDVGEGAYHKLTHGVGIFRAFFNVLKSGTTGTGAPVTRTFITGVSPITMDDVTSGYNIGDNVSLDLNFNRMLGFTEEDITQMIEYYRSKGLIKDIHTTPFLLETMNQWYGNYLFAKQDSTRMYNSDMVLYFFKEYMKGKEFPENLIDRNVRIDYRKLRHLIIIDKKGTEIGGPGEKTSKPTVNGNFSKLKEIIENGNTFSNLVEGFPLEEMMKSRNFKSLLYYLGLLTIKEPYRNQLRLEIPNETIRHLFYDYIESVYRETGIFSLDLSKYEDLMTAMAYDGEWKNFFTFITEEIKNSMSLRDSIEGEKSIQAFLNVYLGLSNLYIIYPEREANKGYADLIMEPFLASYEGINYAFILELKYIERTEKGLLEKKIKKLVKDAEVQLAQYSADKKLAKNLAKTTVIKLVLVFHGHEAVYLGEAKLT